MTRFLRLFRQFRELKADLLDAEARVAECEASLRDRETHDDVRIQQISNMSNERDAVARERDEIRAALQETTTEKLILQDRLDAAQESVGRLWGMVDAAQNRAYRAMESQVNYATQQRFGITPYPEASHLPPSLEPDLESDSIVRRRMAPSELIADQKRKLRNEIVDRLTKTA
jgi:hypothetical protein